MRYRLPLFGFLICLILMVLPVGVDAKENRQKVKFLTMNVWGAPIVSQNTDQRIKLIAQKIIEINPDIVTFQEVFDTNHQKTLEDTLRSNGFAHSHYYKSHYGSGMLLFSKFPIKYTKFEKFKLGGTFYNFTLSDMLAEKGIGYARIDTPLTPIYVVSTHMMYTYKNLFENDDHLVESFQFAHFLNQLSNDYPVVALGDFNTKPESFDYEVITEVGKLKDLNKSSKTPIATTSKYGHIDYIFLREAQGYSYLADTKLVLNDKVSIDQGSIEYSDHFGLLSDIDFIEAKVKGDSNIISIKATVYEKLHKFFNYQKIISTSINFFWLFLIVISFMSIVMSSQKILLLNTFIRNGLIALAVVSVLGLTFSIYETYTYFKISSVFKKEYQPK